MVHELGLEAVGALGVVLDGVHGLLGLHVGVLAGGLRLGGVGDAGGQGGCELVLEGADHVRVGVRGLESEVVHGGFQDVGLSELVLFVLVEVDVLDH